MKFYKIEILRLNSQDLVAPIVLLRQSGTPVSDKRTESATVGQEQRNDEG